jgi:hypothetical protein
MSSNYSFGQQRPTISQDPATEMPDSLPKRKRADVEEARKRLSYVCQFPLYRTHADDPSYDYNNLISVLVGPDKATFTVHENYICAKSKFFKAACSKQWTRGAEGINRVIRLPEEDPQIFKSYVSWVYTNEVVVQGIADRREETGPTVAGKEQGELIKLYVLGDKLDDLALRDQVMKTLVNMNVQTYAASVTWAFEHTPPTSLLRTMLATFAAMRWNRAGFEKESANYPHEFVRAVAVFLMHQTEKDKSDHGSFLKKLPSFLEVEPEA